MATIRECKARQILDSRGNPTIEVNCLLDEGSVGRAAAPSGASTGSHEALELRDGDKKMYRGKSVFKAVKNVADLIAPALKGKAVSDQRTIDQALIDLDGTRSKSRLGANATVAVSMAVCRARAQSEGKQLWESLACQYEVDTSKEVLLPVPMVLVLEGGKHADNSSDFQEFMVVPHGASSFNEALRWGAEIYHATGKVLKEAGYNVNIGYEGAYGPALGSNEKVLEVIMRGIQAAGYEPGKDIGIAIDSAASEFYADGAYHLKAEGKTLSGKQMVDFYARWIDRYPLVSIEDSHQEDDWDGFASMVATMGNRVQLVGDDLLVTNTDRIRQAIEKKAANAVLIKLNQIGTVSETVDAIAMGQKTGWNAVVSHRSGETEDTFIAHLAVGLRGGQIKTGAPCRTDRTCKYNELLRIEEAAGTKAAYASPFRA